MVVGRVQDREGRSRPQWWRCKGDRGGVLQKERRVSFMTHTARARLARDMTGAHDSSAKAKKEVARRWPETEDNLSQKVLYLNLSLIQL
ncbi:hypothetical protein SESBI_25257 [Sesbania bispinosa]|nr:hypothetical protein SESBI_25257 [Sesbania bispinosa]